jgi:hypothetical protein
MVVDDSKRDATMRHSAAVHLQRINELRAATQLRVATSMLREQHKKIFMGHDDVCDKLEKKAADNYAKKHLPHKSVAEEEGKSGVDAASAFLKDAYKKIFGKKFWKFAELFYWASTVVLTIASTSLEVQQSMEDARDSSSVFTPLSKQCYSKMRNAVIWYQSEDIAAYEDDCPGLDAQLCNNSEFSPLRKLTKCVRTDMDRLILGRRDNHIAVAWIEQVHSIWDQMATHWQLDDSAKKLSEDLDAEGRDDAAREVSLLVKLCNLDKGLNILDKISDNKFGTLKEHFYGIPNQAPGLDAADAAPFYKYPPRIPPPATYDPER